MSITPGPWKVASYGEVRGINYSIVARCDYNARKHEIKDNALAISLVPEMLERLTVARLKLRELEALTRRIIRDRYCVCNVAGHPCGTNNMLDDLDAILKPWLKLNTDPEWLKRMAKLEAEEGGNVAAGGGAP